MVPNNDHMGDDGGFRHFNVVFKILIKVLSLFFNQDE